MKRAPTLKSALSVACCKCGGFPDYDWETTEHHMIVCRVCGHETDISVRLGDVTRQWVAMNKENK